MDHLKDNVDDESFISPKLTPSERLKVEQEFSEYRKNTESKYNEDNFDDSLGSDNPVEWSKEKFEKIQKLIIDQSQKTDI